MTDLLNSIKNEFLSLQNSINELTGIKTYIESLKKIINLFDIFFTIIPPEVLLLIIFCAFFLILINNISPTTPRINITIAVIIYSSIWIFINHIFFGEYRIVKVILTSLYILIPAYSVELFKFLVKYFKKLINLKNKIDSREDLSQSIKEINLYYSEFLNTQIEFQKDLGAFKSSVRKLKESIENLDQRL